MGLELDLGVVIKRVKTSLTISFAGIFLTFAISVGVSTYFYNNISGVSSLVDYPKFMLFIGVAMSVTALPVLARILTEQNLLHTPVGISVISAAAVDDAVGWTALALVIVIISAGSPLVGVYILLTMIVFAVFMYFAVRPLLEKVFTYVSAVGNRDSDVVSQPLIIISLAVVLVSSFFTNALGIHAIFGAFITGLILPRHGNFTEKLTEKLEEFVSSILLPLYFTYSGLRTNIGAINSGSAWCGFAMVLFGCMFGKIAGCSIAARICGLNSVEAMAVGVLMSTKGLVEIIILNIGLNAKVINNEVFAIMVLLAIVTTLATTPLITVIYPEAYHNNIDVKVKPDSETPLEEHRLYLLCVPNSASVPSMMKLVHYVSGSAQSAWTSLHTVRLRPLHDRMSSVITAFSSASNSTSSDDHLINAFKMFGSIRGLDIISHMILAQVKDYAKEIAKLAYEIDSDMVIVPYPKKITGKKTNQTSESSKSHDLFSTWYGHSDGTENGSSTESQEDTEDSLKYAVSDALVAEVTTQLVKKSRIPIGVMVERSTLESERNPIILVPFFGGPDDRQALLVGMRLATLPGAELAILHIRALQKLEESQITTESERKAPLLQKLRRRIFNKTESNSSPQEEYFSDNIPEGFSVLPVDAEDSRFIDMVLNYSGPSRGIPSGLLTTPANSVPFRRNGSIPEDIINSERFESIDANATIPNVLEFPKADQHKPTIYLTEIAAIDPAAALMEALKTPESNAFTMIVAGYYGPSYSAAAIVQDGGREGNSSELRSSTTTMSAYWGEITMNTVQGIKATTNTEASVDERVLGPIGSSIVNSGSCDRASLLVVRKFRLAAGGANDL